MTIKNMKKLTVSIGIPAYNEEANIAKLLRSLLAQKQNNFSLKEIIVVSDASVDNTVGEIKKIKNKKIRVIENKKRLGAALSQNKILSHFKSDVLVLINADVLPKNNMLIHYLVQPFMRSKRIGIVGGKTKPLPARTLAEKVINFSVSLKQEIYESLNNSKNIYLCHGRIRAFSEKFASKFRWKPIVGEDAFSYLSCISLGFDFGYQPKGVVVYRSPQSFSDHLKQSVRFLKSRSKMKTLFNKFLVDKEYRTDLNVVLNKSFKYLAANPFLFILYVFVFELSVILKTISPKAPASWDISTSTKKI